MGEPLEVQAALAVGEIEFELDARLPARTASIVIPISMPKPSASGRTSRRAPRLSARCPEIGALSFRPQRRPIAQRAKPRATPRPPPGRVARRPRRPARSAPPRDGVDERAEPDRRARRGPRRRTGSPARAPAGRAPLERQQRGHRHRPPLAQRARPVRPAPPARGRSLPVASLDPSSASQIRTPGKRAAQSGEGRADPILLVAGRDERQHGRAGRSVGGAIYCHLDVVRDRRQMEER